MEIVYFGIAALLLGFVILGVFVLGMLFMKSIIQDAQQEARYDAQRYEYYKLAGVKKPTDPRPYVPPRPITPRARRMLPGMNALERLMKEGKRGTVMWRAGEQKGAE